MSTYMASFDLIVNGYECCHDAEVSYDYEPAGGDGWNEPRHDASVSIRSVEVAKDGDKPQDVMWLLSKECIEGLEADCLQYEQDRRKPDPDYLRDLRENAYL